MPIFRIELKDVAHCTGCPMLDVSLQRQCFWCRMDKVDLKATQIEGRIVPKRTIACVRKHGV